MMIPTLFAGLVALAAVAPAAAAPDPLARYRWSARLVVVVAPSPADPLVAEQKRILADARRGAGERDLTLVEALGEAGDAVAIRRRFGVPDGASAFILVGKDGGAKLRSDRPLPAVTLFEEIDAMPMRRSETRSRPGS